MQARPLHLVGNDRPLSRRPKNPSRDKTMFVYDGSSHFMPLDLVARESLAWLDRYPGRVRLAP